MQLILPVAGHAALILSEGKLTASTAKQRSACAPPDSGLGAVLGIVLGLIMKSIQMRPQVMVVICLRKFNMTIVQYNDTM